MPAELAQAEALAVLAWAQAPAELMQAQALGVAPEQGLLLGPQAQEQVPGQELRGEQALIGLGAAALLL